MVNALKEQVKTVNEYLGKVVQSQSTEGEKHTYFIVDSEYKIIRTTNDKGKASKMKSVLIAFQNLSKEIKSSDEAKIKVGALKERFELFIDHYENKNRGFFGNIVHRIIAFFSGVGVLAKITKENFNEIMKGKQKIEWRKDFEDKNYDYGSKQKERTLYDPETKRSQSETMKTAINYDKYAEINLKEKKKNKESVDQLEELKELKTITFSKFSVAFDEELYKKFNPKWIYEKAAHKFIVSLFEDVVNRLRDGVKNKEFSAEEAVKKLPSLLEKEIASKNAEELELTRDVFRDLMGKKVKDGKGSKLPESLNMENCKKELNQLIKEYNEDTWKEGEIKKLRYDNLDENTMKKMMEALKEIYERKTFEEALTKYLAS